MLARQVATAMEFMHSRQIMHFDLKSDNVLLFPPSDFTELLNKGADWLPKVCDFGFSLMLELAGDAPIDRTQPTWYLPDEAYVSLEPPGCTMEYAAPEVLNQSWHLFDKVESWKSQI